MEWGPRALGNRSLLADPRRAEMRELINVKVKRRGFRPFAPAFLAESASEYLASPHPSPFMTFAFKVNPEKAPLVPATTHVDLTARPQTVSERTNPRFWRLLKAFAAKTGVPVLLNTSFNVQEPIVCTPEHAVACFQRTEVDLLVMNNVVVRRTAQ
ncbi:MAG: carbamoyltransferase C-terminal domain-containing protein [Nitrospiraceae bacterium]